jgi:hypothetical protein
VLHPLATAPNGPRGRIRPLVLSALVLGTLAWLADGATGLVVVLAMTVLVAAALLRGPARPGADTPALTPPTEPGADDAGTADDVTERLRRLYDDHVEQLNMAVAEERHDLVQELSDHYMDEALRLITAGERPLSVR